MARPARKLGLKSAIFSSFTIALIVTFGILWVVVPAQTERFLVERLQMRGRTIAQEVRDQVVVTGTEVDAKPAVETLNKLASEREVRFAGVVDPDGRVLARGNRTDQATLTEAARSHRDERHPNALRLPEQDVLVAETLKDDRGRPLAYVLVGMDGSANVTVVEALERTVLLAFLGAFILFLLAVWWISRRFILRPLKGMMGMASRLSEADLTSRVEEISQDELGGLAEALNRISSSLRETVSRIRGVSEGVAQVIEQISRTGNAVSAGASTTFSRVEETSSSMVEMLATLRGIAENVEVLYQSAEESSSSIMQMAATNDEVAENVQAMAASVQETTSAIEEMTYSIKEVAKNVDALLSSTEETSTAINEMDVSINQVETNAYETARLSEQVTQDAVSGVEALQKTLTGIDKIKDSSRSASTVIESLGRRIGEIGNIIDVIDDVAEQTNLLALNAAIIAAQAGEHGKGFAVVAEEIKELAERTGVSTKEIAELIRRVTDESRNAVLAMNQGVRNVEEGVQLGREAESALKKISESANKSTLMVKAIARATVEQARGSKSVTTAVQRIAESVQQISKATNEQARGSEQIISSAEKMKAITSHVQRSTQEQAHGSKQITRSIESINEMVQHLNRAQTEQTQGSEQVLKAVEAIKTVAEQQTRSSRQLEEAIETLQKQAEVLRAEVRRFRV
ncbi:MAG: methyl-accepting chemotaxis protein [Myxococcota bacterium]|nr:methyl-accepting chemotaxis protein [Myxococcota bacterium]